MIEAMATLWLGSFVLSLIATLLNVNAVRKQLKSKRLSTLNTNLAKVNLFWDNSKGDYETLTADAIPKDAVRSLRSAAMVGLLGFASVPGFIFLVIIILSIRFLGRSRQEIEIFHSPLANDPGLTPDAVKIQIEEIKARV